MNTPAAVDRYRVVGEIGRGGMGCVYKAHDPSLDRFVAVKTVIRSASTESPMTEEELRARFLREAQLAARLDHPGIVRVHDAGADGPLLWIVMELIQGMSLAQRLRVGCFPSRPASLRLVAEIADALGAAHSAGIVHRDIKPSNILITADGQLKVSDFGVSRAIGEDTALTQAGSTVGSPAYMAPEQITGEKVDPRADLFSLGVIAYQLLFHRRPFPAETMTTLIYQILNHDPLTDDSIVTGLEPGILNFLTKALAKKAEERFSTAEAMAHEARNLATALDNHSPTVSEEDATILIRTPASTNTRKRPRRRPILLAGVALAIILMTLAVGAVVIRALKGPDRSPQTVQSIPTEVHKTGVQPILSPTPEHDTPQDKKRLEPETEIVDSAPAIPTPTSVRRTPTPFPQPTAAPVQPAPTQTPRPPPTPTATPVVIDQRFACRHGAEFHVSPEEAIVTVDGRELGIADDWDGNGGGSVYYFEDKGRHLVKLTCPGYTTAWIQITVTDFADDEIVEVGTELEEGR